MTPGKSEVSSSVKRTWYGLSLSNKLLGYFDSGYSVSHTVSTCVFVLMKIQAGLFCGCLVSFLLSWPWQWVFLCVCVSPVVSCLRLARISEPPQAPGPSTPTISSDALLSCPVQACIIYPPACLLLCASWSAPWSVWICGWTCGNVENCFISTLWWCVWLFFF